MLGCGGDYFMADLPAQEYLATLDTAAHIAQLGVAIFRWEASQRFPVYEWANAIVTARTKIDSAAAESERSSFFERGNNAQLARMARAHLEACDEAPFEVEITTRSGDTYWIECVVRLLGTDPHGMVRFVLASREIERRKAHEAFGKLLSTAVDRQPDGVFIVRMDESNPLTPPLVYANAAFSHLTGFSQEDLAAGVYPALLGDRSDHPLVEEHARAIMSGRSIVTKLELTRKDGTRFRAEVRAHPIESPPVHCVLIVHDITDRWHEEEEMSLLSEAVSQASDFVIVTDDMLPSDGGPTILYVNPSFLDATGYETQELIGKPYLAIYSRKNTPKIMDAILAAIKQGNANYREILAARKDGSAFWIEFVERPFTTRHGRRLRLTIGRDITLRRRSSSQLSLLFAAAEHSKSPIVIYEPDEVAGLCITYENEAAAQLAYYHLITLWKSADADSQSIRERLEHGEEVELTYAMPTVQHGNQSIVHLTARAIRNESRVEAILTQERFVESDGTPSDFPKQGKLIEMALMIPALARAKTAGERIETLRVLVHNAFGAELVIGTDRSSGGVRIDEQERLASFPFEGQTTRVSWKRPLEALELTALRFCIETTLRAGV
jgi:PAS domain S-box-containing protein